MAINLSTLQPNKAAVSVTTNKLLGRFSAGTGPAEEIILGTNLSLSGNVLNATGDSGGTTSTGASVQISSVTITATAGQTAFTGIPEFVVGAQQVKVYVNGFRLYLGDYVETNTTTVTLNIACSAGDSVLFEVYALTASTVSSGQNSAFIENDQNVSVDYSITAGKNAMSAGPITINPGVTVTVPTGSVWTIV